MSGTRSSEAAMRKLIILLWSLLLCAPAFAQLPLTGAGLGKPTVAATYVGPVNIVSSPLAWWGLRSPSAADLGNALINACNPGDATCADLSSNASTGNLTVSAIGGEACSVSVTSGTYVTATGATSLVIASTPHLVSGNIFALTALTGTGSFVSLQDIEWTATTGTTGTTVNFTGPTGLGTVTITGGTINVCTIKTFYDRSGLTSCSSFACDQVQATLSLRAILVPVSSLTSALPGAVLTGANQTQYFTAHNVTATNQPLTVSVITLTGSTSQGEIFTDSSFNFQNAFTTTTTYRLYAGTVRDTTGLTASTSHIFQAIFNSGASASFLNVDGTLHTYGTPGTAGLGTVAANPLSIGSAGAGTANYAGYLFEIGVWPIAFSTTATTGQAALMCHNQFAYWGTSTSC